MSHSLRVLALALVLFSLPFAAMSENMTEFDGYAVHHNAFTSDILTPQVAKAYAIQRSKNRGVLTISVIDTAQQQSIQADVIVTAVNLSGQTKTIVMRQIQEDEAIYYLGDFRVSDEETLDFSIKVTPPDARNPLTMQLSQQFFAE
jgi:hypothetical protein